MNEINAAFTDVIRLREDMRVAHCRYVAAVRRYNLMVLCATPCATYARRLRGEK